MQPDIGRAAGDVGEEQRRQVVGELAVAVVETVDQVTGGGAGLRVLGEAGRQERQQRLGYAGEVGVGVADAVEEVGGGARTERAVAGGGEDEDTGEREHIARGRVFLPARLLRRHEGGRAGRRSRPCEVLVAGRPGDTEVDDLRAVRGDEDVRGLQVAVDHVRGVQLGEGPGERRAQGADGRLGERAAERDGVVERRAEDVLGGQPGCLGQRIGVDDGRAVAGADDPRRVRLQPETGTEGGVGGEPRVHGLERDGTAAGGARQIDRAHAAGAEAGEETVGGDVGRVVVGQGRQHG